MYTLAYSTNISMQAHESNIKDPEKKINRKKDGKLVFSQMEKMCNIKVYK